MTPEQKQLLAELNRTPYGKAVLAFLEEEERRLEADLKNETLPLESLRGAQKGLKVVERLRTAMGQEKPKEKKIGQYE